MFVDDNGIVRFEGTDELNPIETTLNTALTSVSVAIDELRAESGTWIPLTLVDFKPGVVTPEYRVVGDRLDLRGDIVTVSGSIAAGKVVATSLPEIAPGWESYITVVGLDQAGMASLKLSNNPDPELVVHRVRIFGNASLQLWLQGSLYVR